MLVMASAKIAWQENINQLVVKHHASMQILVILLLARVQRKIRSVPQGSTVIALGFLVLRAPLVPTKRIQDPVVVFLFLWEHSQFLQRVRITRALELL
jgi:hypothetical protein